MRFTIKTKLVLAFGGLLVCVAGTGAVGLTSLSSANGRMQDFAQRPFAQVQRVGQLNLDLASMARNMNRSLLESSDEGRAAARKTFETLRADFDQTLKAYADLVPADTRDATVGPVREGWAAYQATTEKAWGLIIQNSQNKATSGSFNDDPQQFALLSKAYTGFEEQLKQEVAAGALAHLGAFRLDVETMRLDRFKLILAMNGQQIEDFTKEYRSALAAAAAELEAAVQNAGDPASAQVQALRHAFTDYTAFEKRLVDLGAANTDATATDAITTGAVKAARDAMVTRLTDLQQYEGKVAGDIAAQTQHSYEATSVTLVSLLAGAVLAGIALATWMALSIARGLAASVRVAEAVASGDLTQDIAAKGQDEIGDLQRALKAMVEKLRDVVGQVSVAARNVSAGSQELSASAEQLSQGSTEQAASTEEASASMEEMAANVKQNADNAGQTETIARRSAADAEASGAAVDKAVEAMQTIAAKITVVQEIARQTDLLALNAAVEAARAGEHGRGFAVVASEVRKLAERSQQAATEIGALSSDTVKAASAAGAMLSKLVPDIRRTAELVEEITAACREQDVGSTQINQAIGQLDKVTQQNAAASEQVSATSEELSSQAEQLQASVAFFRTDGNAAAPAAAHPVATLQKRLADELKPARVPAASRSARGKAVGGFALDMAEPRDARDDGFRRAS